MKFIPDCKSCQRERRERELLKSIMGYVVVNEWGPLRLYRRSEVTPDYPKSGILLRGIKGGTIFRSRRSAWEAIKRTRSYSEKNGLKWTINGDMIFGVELPILEKPKKKGAKRG